MGMYLTTKVYYTTIFLVGIYQYPESTLIKFNCVYFKSFELNMPEAKVMRS
jgi:hypothetical protein